jgi:predicted nucleic acid-binding protein
VIGLDTSVVVRLLIGEPAVQARAARRLMAERRRAGEAAAVSDLVVGEAYFALRHHYEVPHAQAVDALRSLLNDPGVVALGAAREVLASGHDVRQVPGFMDRLIHADYARAPAALVTFDRAASRLSGTELVGED